MNLAEEAALSFSENIACRGTRRFVACLAVLACLGLCACEIVSGDEAAEGDVAVQSVSAIDSGAVAVETPLPDAAQMAARATGGAVTVYGLDGNASDTPGSGGRQTPLALQSAADPSVDVYPLDYGLVELGTRWAGSGILMPSGRQAMMGAASDGIVGANGSVRLFFAHGSSRIMPDSRRALEELAAWAGRTGGAIVVEGHASRRASAADPVGKESVNLKQSLDRAYVVSRELLRLGVAADRVTTSGFGDSRPALAEPERSAEAASRRVEIYTEDELPGVLR